MKEFQVTCITKPDRFNVHEHITHIGNPQMGWSLTRESAIARIESGREKFYTVDPLTGKRAYIGVVKGDGAKAPYLRTHADGYWNDNLLALAECKGSCSLIS